MAYGTETSMQNAAMAKDKTFNLRLDAEDRARLEVLARQYSAPAATVIRMLIKRDFDAVSARLPHPTEPQTPSGS